MANPDVEMMDVSLHTDDNNVCPATTPQKMASSRGEVASPASSCLSSLSRPSPPRSLTPSLNGGMPSNNTPTSNSNQDAVKRRKPTAEEKEARKREQAERREAREAQAAVKAVEKAKREEERKAKDAERESKKRKREEEKEAKESEKRKKEEEKKKEDKSQLKMNAFLVKPCITHKEEQHVPAVVTKETVIQSIEASPVKDEVLAEPSRPQSESPTKKTHQTEYQRSFPPFFVQSHVTLAPPHRSMRDPESLKSSQQKLDEVINNGANTVEIHQSKEELFELFGKRRNPLFKRRKRGTQHVYTKDVMAALQGTAAAPIDLTKNGPVQTPTDLLKLLTIKYLKFAEDVRPPYRGTFTKFPPAKSALRLGRNPFERSLPNIDYDYDSEAEWEEPEEGEDLVSEGEEEGSEDGGADDLEGFLDDEEVDEGAVAVGAKRRVIVADLEPVCTGLCWENGEGQHGGTEVKFKMEDFKLESLLEHPGVPIDPYSVTYWQTPMAPPPIEHSSTRVPGLIANLLNPSRVPLHAINRPNAGVNSQLPVSSDTAGKVRRVSGRSKATDDHRVPDCDIQRFKEEIEGSDLTKAGLIEVLKKKFPNLPKDAIKNTLSTVAARVGKKEVEKRWRVFSVPENS